jgi:hypothetical protein
MKILMRSFGDDRSQSTTKRRRPSRDGVHAFPKPVYLIGDMDGVELVEMNYPGG